MIGKIKKTYFDAIDEEIECLWCLVNDGSIWQIRSNLLCQGNLVE